MPETGTVCWTRASGWVHREPGNVCMKRQLNVERSTEKEKKVYKSYEELSLMLTVLDVASVLGVSRAGAYKLAHSEGFLVLNVGSRIVIPRDNCTFDAKKMIVDQFVKAVYVKRGF